MESLILIKISSENAKKKFKKVRKQNQNKLCRYFTLIYNPDYASSLVGKRCNDK